MIGKKLFENGCGGEWRRPHMAKPTRSRFEICQVQKGSIRNTADYGPGKQRRPTTREKLGLASGPLQLSNPYPLNNTGVLHFLDAKTTWLLVP